MISIPESKALCPKPVSAEVWRYDEIRDHWDRLELRSWATTDAGWRLYQAGHLGALLAVDALLGEVRAAGYEDLSECIVFGGTLPVAEGFAFARRFEAELYDPALDRRLTCAYDVDVPGYAQPGR